MFHKDAPRGVKVFGPDFISDPETGTGRRVRRQFDTLAAVRREAEVLWARGSDRGRLVTPFRRNDVVEVLITKKDRRVKEACDWGEDWTTGRAFGHEYDVVGEDLYKSRGLTCGEVMCAAYPLFEALLVFEKNGTPHLDIHAGNAVLWRDGIMLIDPQGATEAPEPVTFPNGYVIRLRSHVQKLHLEGMRKLGRPQDSTLLTRAILPELASLVDPEIAAHGALLADTCQAISDTLGAVNVFRLRTILRDSGASARDHDFRAVGAYFETPAALAKDDVYRAGLMLLECVGDMGRVAVVSKTAWTRTRGDAMVAEFLELLGNMACLDYAQRFTGRRAYQTYLDIRRRYCVVFTSPASCAVIAPGPSGLRLTDDPRGDHVAVYSARTSTTPWVPAEQDCAFLGFSGEEEEEPSQARTRDTSGALSLRQVALRFGVGAVREVLDAVRTHSPPIAAATLDTLRVTQNAGKGPLTLTVTVRAGGPHDPAQPVSSVMEEALALAEGTAARRHWLGLEP